MSDASLTHTHICNACGAGDVIIFCQACHTIQPFAQSLCYFKMLGLEKTLPTDLEALDQVYRQIQKQVHPDNFINAPSREKLYAAQWSQTLNQAYGTLKDPIETGFYILRAHEGGAVIADKEITHDPDLLIYVYEQQEEIDGCSNPKVLLEMDKVYQEKLASLMQLINQSFIKGELEKAHLNLNTAQYLKKLQQSVLGKLEKTKGVL